MAKRSKDDGLVLSFISGLIAGLAISAPVAAWLSPRRGDETRAEIRQRGLIIRRKAGTTVRKPIEQVQSQIGQLSEQVGERVDQLQERVGERVDKIQEQVGSLQERVKGESVEDSLTEGRAIAAQKRREYGETGGL